MAWRVNPNRLFESLTADKVAEAGRAGRALLSGPVLKGLLSALAVCLGCLFLLLLTVRVALTLPLPWQP